jgi:predicted anti-sigma-YlaC factor YlaD
LISCADFMAAIGDCLEGDVAAEVRVQLETHLSHCKTCQVVYDSARKTVRVLTDSGSFDLPDSAAKPITEKIMARIRGQERPS